MTPLTATFAQVRPVAPVAFVQGGAYDRPDKITEPERPGRQPRLLTSHPSSTRIEAPRIMLDRPRADHLAPPCRVLVTGSRDWPDYYTIAHALEDVASEQGFYRLVVVHGACPGGADEMADVWALTHTDRGVSIERHPARWDVYGRRAGPLRNLEMVKLGADACLAFIRDNSRGATHCAAEAERHGIPVRRWTA